MSLPLRAWQAEAIPLAWQAIRSRERGALHACTGSGKSRVIEEVCATIARTLHAGSRVVVSVPTVALVDQTHALLAARLGHVGRWYTHAHHDAPFVVACNDSLGDLATYWQERGLRCAHWLADEVHRCGPEVRAAVEVLRPATQFGMSATPFRSDREETIAGWDRCVYSYPIHRAIEEGVLVPMRLVPWTGEDGADTDEAVAEMIREHAPEGPGIVSAQTIADAEHYAAYLTRRGIAAAAIHCASGRNERRDLIARLKRMDLWCLVHVQLLTEGIDLPWLQWLAMRRPRKAAVGIVQEVGRVLRAADGKTEAVILLPHATPILSSLARRPALSPIELARCLAAAEQDEVDADRPPLDDVMPPASAVGDVAAYVAALCAVAREAGVDVSEVGRGDWRDTGPTVPQIEALADRIEAKGRDGISYLPAEHRTALRRVLHRPEVLTRGTLADTIVLVDALRRHAGIFARANSSHFFVGDRFWRGLRHGLPEVPSVAVEHVAPKSAFRRRPKLA